MDWVLTGLTLTGNYIVSKKNPWGWVIFGIASLLWFWYSMAILNPSQYGLAFGAIVNFAISVRGGYQWFGERS